VLGASFGGDSRNYVVPLGVEAFLAHSEVCEALAVGLAQPSLPREDDFVEVDDLAPLLTCSAKFSQKPDFPLLILLRVFLGNGLQLFD